MDSIPQTDGARLKRCSACKLDKPLSEFYPIHGTPGSYRCACKPCDRAKRQQRITHPYTPRQPRSLRTCAQCGGAFLAAQSLTRPMAGRYCSYPCAYAGRTRSMAERFWSHVDQSGGPDACWPWTARRNKRGYGIVNRGLDGRGHAASRVAWELIHGPIPVGLFVCHNCPGGDNPACCNPAHFFLGTQADNLTDARKKGRRPTRKAGLSPVSNNQP